MSRVRESGDVRNMASGGALQLKLDSTHDSSFIRQLGTGTRLRHLPELWRCCERAFLRKLRLTAGRRPLRSLRDDPDAGREILPSLRHRSRRTWHAPPGFDLDDAPLGDRRYRAGVPDRAARGTAFPLGAAGRSSGAGSGSGCSAG